MPPNAAHVIIKGMGGDSGDIQSSQPRPQSLKNSEINHRTICNGVGAIKEMGMNSKSFVTDGCYSHL